MLGEYDHVDLLAARERPVTDLVPVGAVDDFQNLYRSAFAAQDLATVLAPYERGVMTLQAS